MLNQLCPCFDEGWVLQLIQDLITRFMCNHLWVDLQIGFVYSDIQANLIYIYNFESPHEGVLIETLKWVLHLTYNRTVY